MINSVLTRPKSLQELYRTYFSFANKFEFTNLMKTYAQNDEWRETSKDTIWDALSKVSDDIGSVLADDIINYTRNVVDINTCKVPQLIEHAKMLSYGLEHIKNSYDYIPRRIQLLIDIFSINPEYLFGNYKNHLLSDQVIKEILVFIRESGHSFSNDDAIALLIEDPHGLIELNLYMKFLRALFKSTIKQALIAQYSNEDETPIVFNLLYKERRNQSIFVNEYKQYKTWVDKYIQNEVEHPLNDSYLGNTLYDKVQLIKNQKKMSSKFNPFKVADHIYFNGLNPTNNLNNDELDLVEMVIDYHSKPRYDYETESFTDGSKHTPYAYYTELEWCEYVKMVMFIWNNLNSFKTSELSYDIKFNKFIQDDLDYSSNNCLNLLQIFHTVDGNGDDKVIENSDGSVALDEQVLDKVSSFLCDYVVYIQGIRENMKTIAQKHAMRGTGALIVHIVNDYLIKEMPFVRDNICGDGSKFEFGWEDARFRNYGNVHIVEYMDDNEYFNIDPFNDVRFTQRTNERYWEKLNSSDQIGVFTKDQIKNFYRNVLGMGVLQPKKRADYDDIHDFLVDLFKIGANPIRLTQDDELYNPIDDIIQRSEEEYGYTKSERLDVQKNVGLRKSQEVQFNQYSGNENLIGNGMYEFVNNKLFYWKNIDYSSHMLHPFMYNLKLWNKLNNIIINGYKDYVNSDLIDIMSSAIKFDELFGEFGESRNFWKYNVMDMSGYTTRYEAAVKDDHIDDEHNTISPLTGYDGMFYPDAARDFINFVHDESDFTIDSQFFKCEYDIDQDFSNRPFMKAIYSVYWQDNGKNNDTFYTKWYSHLNYSRSEYQKIAMQLWYWRDRIVELITTDYPITKYCLDIRGNSLIMVQTIENNIGYDKFKVDLRLAQDKVQQQNGNMNLHVSTCSNDVVLPSELWVRWKSNPIAMPLVDVHYQTDTGCEEFDKKYRKGSNSELGQMALMNNESNDNFAIVLKEWLKYGFSDNRFPVFFDMEQSANVLVLGSWYRKISDIQVKYDAFDQDDYDVNCCKNPYHIVSVERTTNPTEWELVEYGYTEAMNASDGMLFDSYHYCPANGSILVPKYGFDCNDSDVQKLIVQMFLIPAQELKMSNFSSQERVVQLGKIAIDLNEEVKFNDGYMKPRFDNPVKVCRNTNVVFAPYESAQMNKVRLAFLGNIVDENYMTSFKVNSCQAKTRYEFDSQEVKELCLANGDFNDSSDSNFIDSQLLNDGYNSYDSLDKHVLMIDFEPSIDNKVLFDMSVSNGMNCKVFNILSDAGYIPHFAYQSLVRYDKNDKDAGISYVYKNDYLNQKKHLQFELLGIDDKDIKDVHDAMTKLVVHDGVDDCDTLLNPSRVVDDIYRIYECQDYELVLKEGTKRGLYFSNEYKDYSNPELKFNGASEIEYEWDETFQLVLPPNEDDISSVLSEYYVTVVRTSDYDILNEKRFILPPTRLSDILVMSDDQGYVECNLSPWKSAMIDESNNFVKTQVLFTGTQNPFNYDENGNKIYSRPEQLQYGNSICGVDSIKVKVNVDGTSIRPTVLIKKHDIGNSLNDKVQMNVNSIKPGEFKVIFSYRNVDNIVKYHLFNEKSNLYFNSSLPTDKSEQFKCDEFKFIRTVLLVEDSNNHWVSKQVDDNGNPVIEFNLADVKGYTYEGHLVPPYYIVGSDGETPKWFLEQEGMVESGDVKKFKNPDGKEVEYAIPTSGNFKFAHEVLYKPHKYTDYLYVNRGGLSFKVNEESNSFADAFHIVPGYEIDRKMKNKLDDFNDIQILKEYSTFIHQSENPDRVRNCGSFNPLVVNAVLKYGIEKRDGGIELISTNEDTPRLIELDNFTSPTKMSLQLEDGEIDDYLKIYTNYVKVDDGNGDFHFDLYFNIQNLLNSPFEYISSITNQPNVRILKDSYLYLSGDKYTNGKIDEDKVKKIYEGGELSIYGQVKTYSNDILSDVKTIKLFSYKVYNVSDDKPKFLIQKVHDITTNSLKVESGNPVRIKFSNVMWTMREDWFKNNEFKDLNQDVELIQPLHIYYNWDRSDNFRVNSISFDIVNDLIDFENTPELYDKYKQSLSLSNDGKHWYNGWSDRYMKFEMDEFTKNYRMTLKYDDRAGFNFETIYLKWRLPTGFRVMDTIDRLSGRLFNTTAQNIVVECNSNMGTTDIEVVKGTVTARVEKIGTMYLGLEHSTTKRMNGFVLEKLSTLVSSAIQNAIKETSHDNSDRTLKNKKIFEV